MRRYLPVALLSLLVCSVWLYTLLLPSMVMEPRINPNQDTPASVDLAFEPFSVTPRDADLQLQGWWMPAPQPRAAILFVHGAGSNRSSGFVRSLDLYRALVDNQVSVAAIELRNHGESDLDEHGLQFGRTEQFDVLAALEWLATRANGLPRYAMGVSMGGATVIRAAAAGAEIDGLILLDPLLHTESAITRGAWVDSGLPPALFTPAALAAVHLHGLPGGVDNAGNIAAELALPILLIQDPLDPVTLAVHARELAARNPRVRLWEAPPVANDHPELAFKGRWGSHVAAFHLYPEETVTTIMSFLAGLRG